MRRPRVPCSKSPVSARIASPLARLWKKVPRRGASRKPEMSALQTNGAGIDRFRSTPAPLLAMARRLTLILRHFPAPRIRLHREALRVALPIHRERRREVAREQRPASAEPATATASAARTVGHREPHHAMHSGLGRQRRRRRRLPQRRHVRNPTTPAATATTSRRELRLLAREGVQHLPLVVGYLERHG